MSSSPKIGITIGDPSGIGPEVTLKAIARLSSAQEKNIVIIGDSFVLSKISGFKKTNARLIDLQNVSRTNFAWGKISPCFGSAAKQYLDKALELLKRGAINCLVTAPVSKEAISLSGCKFSGHTEYLAQKTRTKQFAMMFYAGKLRVTLVTRHIPLNQVANKISPRNILESIMLTDSFLRKFLRIRNPRIVVCGLNPHAGEDGLLGKEEGRIIKPALAKARKYNRFIVGPLPGDTVFIPAHFKKFDAVIAMYHDQGMIPVKALAFDSCVNVTLGLPFIRTSPCHGTAFDIAGKNIADPSSMLSAIKLAASLSGKSS